MVHADAEGIHFDGGCDQSLDVRFGGRRAWAFVGPGRAQTVQWPRLLKRIADGWADVEVVTADEDVLFEGRVAFTATDRQVDLVDDDGIPFVIDKWGLIQRPFEVRDPGIVGELADQALRMVEVLRRDCGIEAWMGFGTLLGARRSGTAIGHDSDVDLCYLSEKETPAEMAAELYAAGRALRQAGMRVVHKNGSFLTVQVRGSDGAGTGIDLYTTFFSDGFFYESATVRHPLERSAVVPIGELPFEGRMLPAPADPDALLTVSYGPGFMTPDPSFRHEPGDEIHDRFEGWFGSLFRQRREWRRNNAAAAETGVPSPFARWVDERIAPGAPVAEIGCGGGADAQLFAQAGRDVVALDFAVPDPSVRRRDPRITWRHMNLYDLRSVLASGAFLALTPGDVVYAREVVESVAPDARAAFWQLVTMALAGGGDLYLEGVTVSPARAGDLSRDRGARVWSVHPDEVVDAARAAGGQIIHREGLLPASRAHASGGTPQRWRLVVTFPRRLETSS